MNLTIWETLFRRCNKKVEGSSQSWQLAQPAGQSWGER